MNWLRERLFGIGLAVFVAAMLVWISISAATGISALHKYRLNRAYLMGSQAKENGLPIQSNPFVPTDEREAFRKGWRSATIIKD